MTQRDVMGREVGGGFMFGNACTPVEDSCQCMAKPIQYCKVKKKKIITKRLKTYVRLQAIKLLEVNTGSTLFDIGLSDILFDAVPRERDTKAKINKWDYIELKSFYTLKETIKKIKR